MAAPATPTNISIEDIKKKLEKRYSGSSELFPDLTQAKSVDVIPAPSAIINCITGIGGLPRGRVTEIHGPFSSGKTTIASEIGAAAQAADPEAKVLFVDFEHAFDAAYGRKLGLILTPDRFIFSQPEYFEQGADIALELVPYVDMIVIDSAAAMTPRSELEGTMDQDGGSQKGTQAALMAQFLSKITKKLGTGRKPALVLINQTRAVINIGGRPRPGAPKEQAAGGNAIKFYTSLRMELEPMNNEGDGARGTKGTDQVYTQTRVRITVVKNKLAPPFMRGQIVIEYGKGINNLVSIGELAEAHLGIMSGAGFFKYEGHTQETSFSCRGRDAFLKILEESTEIQKEIEARVLKTIQDKHATMLGLDEIKVSGKAKTIDQDESDNESRMIISGNPSNTFTPLPGQESNPLPIDDIE